jgi:putative ABC transport system permease protein
MIRVLRSLFSAASLLRRRPLFSLVTMATLALGIAANTAIFSLVEATVLRRPPYPDSGRLVVVREVGTRGQEMQTSEATALDWERSGVFSASSAYAGDVVTALIANRPVRALGQLVEPGFFDAFQATPQLGRVPRQDEARAPVAVVSDRFWRQTLRGAPLDGTKVEALGVSFDVIGVMRPEFDFPTDTQLWVPKGAVIAEESASRSAHNYRFVGRLAPGVTLAAAERRIDALTRQVAGSGPDRSDAAEYLPVGAHLRTLQVDGALPVRQALMLLLGAAAFVLLVACLNLASTFLARGLERERELAVRTALGASRARLLGQLLAEAVLLAIGGAIGGIGLALWLGRAILAVAPPLLAGVGLHVGGAASGYTVLAAVVSVLVVGLLPALVVTQTPGAALRSGRSEGISPTQRRVWAALMATQGALALLLLVGTGLLLTSFASLLSVEPGFDARQVATLALAPPESRYADAPARVAFQSKLLAAVEALPGVEQAGLVSELPFGRYDPSGRMKAEPDRFGDASYRVASAGYFRALRIPLVEGRLFDARDGASAAHAAIVDRRAAALFWPGEDPIGKRISSEGMDAWGISVPGQPSPKAWAAVVGVVGEVRNSDLAAPPDPCVYFAMTQRPPGDATLVARSRSTAGALFPGLEATLSQVAPDVPGESSTLAEVLAAARAQRRFALILLATFAALALALAAVGVYGVVACSVSRRTRELGVRLALGAAPAETRALVLRGALRPVTLGVLLGLVAALPLSRSLEALLFSVHSWDRTSWLGASAVASVLLLGVAALAGWLPARRAGRLDPQLALRAE